MKLLEPLGRAAALVVLILGLIGPALFARAVEPAWPAPVVAATMTEPTLVGPSPLTAGELIASLSVVDGPAAVPRLKPLHAVSEGPSDVTWVYGGANAAGQLQSYFRTDIYYSGSGQGYGNITFDLWVLPAGQDNRAAVGRRYTISDNSYGVFQDVVGSFGAVGAATVLVAVDAEHTNAIGAFAQLSIWGRTFTAGAAGGAYSTTLPAGTGWLISADTYTVAPGVVQSAEKRSNINIFNHSNANITCRVDIYSQDQNLGPLYIDVPPLSSTQRGLGAFSIPEPGGDVFFSLTSGFATAFVVTVDNTTNDGDLKLASYREYAACPNIAGTWAGAFANRCGAYNGGYIVVSQTGCSFTAATALGSLTGKLIGSRGSFRIISGGGCTGNLDGYFDVFSAQGISGTFSGNISGFGCCTGVDSGSFTMGR
jgi:hypothetical protein